MSDASSDWDHDEDLSEWVDHQQLQSDNHDVSVESVVPKKRGRPRLQEKWTRVVSLHQYNPASNYSFDIFIDLLLASNLPTQSIRKHQQAWKPLFFPKAFVEDHWDIRLDDFRLTPEQLE